MEYIINKTNECMCSIYLHTHILFYKAGRVPVPNSYARRLNLPSFLTSASLSKIYVLIPSVPQK